MTKYIFNMIDNNIYLYHTDTLVVLPTYADSITETMSASFSQTTPLARSAPIYSYSSSGPRQLTITLDLHRDMMQQINYQVSNLKTTMDDDYVDQLVRNIQSAVLPRYSSTDKMVDPPLGSLKIGDNIFIKGVTLGSVNVTYNLPILRSGKYASIKLQFTIAEVDPYGAEEVAKAGSYRGLSTTLERRVYKLAR